MCEKKKKEDLDMHVAQLIMQNRQCSISGQADDEYGYNKGPNRTKRGKCDDVSKSMRNTRFPKHILIQQELCLLLVFCYIYNMSVSFKGIK